ncbi:UDP-glucose 4-epimerase GalE [uncultured Amaricoccus sp.]|uniref:UDP-glucose 4-epimerase GalE n=1 Tax=uncultured Amaricoccus sp. TaxID=339341 RepID=UPI002604576E|nr:UDP-glucose 4-epimerase GalE [uncultured Amaricoccus sp.]
MRILITGGAGYIGSHTLVEVLKAGHAAHVVDNLDNASPVALARVKQLANRDFGFTRADIRDAGAMAALVAETRPEAVIHFAGLKAVGESVADPLGYFDNNVGGSLALLRALRAADCRRFVFSSSATVYGDPDYLPIDESHPRRTTNPYGRSKLQIEGILEDLAASDPSWSIALLRYFNPVGAHASGRIGEDPTGVPNNLMPFIAQVAVGRRPALNVFGTDYPTPDGTGVRDYIHVSDLARAHLAAVDWTAGRAGEGETGVGETGVGETGRGCAAFNLGTGQGTSVLEMARAFGAASGREIAVNLAPRRPGDVAACYADAGRAAAELGWRAELGLAEMCASTWHWQSQNPGGYSDEGAEGAA